MERWFTEVGKQVLAEALSNACDQAVSKFQTVYTQNSAQVASELESLRRTASRVHQLEEENNVLKAEIASLSRSNRENSADPIRHREGGLSVRTPLAPRSVNQPASRLKSAVGKSSRVDIEGLSLTELKAEYLRVESSRARLQDEYLKSQQALSKSNELLRDRTSRCQDWFSHAQKLSEQGQKRLQQIKKLKTKLAEFSKDSVNSSFSSDSSNNEPTPESGIFTTGRPFDDHSSATARHNLDGREEEAPRLPSLPSPLPSSRVYKEAITIKSEPSSDTPVLVSEHKVRKRKNHDDGEEAELPAVARVKLEHGAGSQDEPRHYIPHESIDFDAEVRQVATPKKHTRHQTLGEQSAIRGLDISLERPSDINHHSSTGTRNEAHRNRRDKGGDTGDLIGTERSSDTTVSNSPVQPSRLRPMDPVPRKGLSRALAQLAEYDDRSNKPAPFANMRMDQPMGVLDTLLNTGSVPQLGRASKTTRPPHDGHRPSTHVSQTLEKTGKLGPKTVASALGNVDAPSDHSTYSRASSSTLKGGSSTRKKAMPPLRQRPKSELRLEDFKINPETNAGLDYAFKDVVRDKGERADMQGCVQERCCGPKYRLQAQAARDSTGPFEFQSLLEGYLGDACHRLGSMTEAEKEEMWIEAKMRELSNATNTHRHRYSPISTPPGFWDTDFPTTQQCEEDRLKAAKMERQIVEERYREAMRPGGRWMFRDE